MVTLFGRRINPKTGKATGGVRALLSDYAECVEKRIGDILPLWEGDFVITEIKFSR